MKTLRWCLGVGLAMALIWVLSYYLQHAQGAYPHFDGALNLNVSKSLADGHGYGSFYDRYALFPIETQTNAPYVVPAAGMLALLGLTPFAGQVVNLIYLFGLALIIAALSWRLTRSPLIALAAPLVVLQVPGVADFGMNGYGELPALFWFVVALWSAERAISNAGWPWLLTTGIALGLSVLTKTVALIWVPVLIIALHLTQWRAWQWRQQALSLGWLLAGFMFALLAWEVVRLWQLGALDQYIAWWGAQFSEIAKQSGAEHGYRDTPGRWAKLSLHSQALAGYFGLPIWGLVLMALSVALAGLLALLRCQTAGQRFVLLSLGGVAFCYLVWWLLITPTEFMWLRRVMNGLIALAWLAVLSAGLLWSTKTSAPWLRVVSAGSLLGALAAVFGSQLILNRVDRTADAAADREFYDAIRALPEDATLFGSGWWQAPVAALYSGRRIHDEERWNSARFGQTPGDKYLVLDVDALNLGEWTRKRLDWRCLCEEVWRSPRGAIFKIQALRDHPDDARPGEIEQIVGLHEEEGDSRWASPWSAFPLEQTPIKLEIDALVPELSKMDLEGETPLLSARFGNCASETLVLQPGRQTWTLSPQCPLSGATTLWITVNYRLDPLKIAPDRRDLAWRYYGLQLTAARAEAGQEAGVQ